MKPEDFPITHILRVDSSQTRPQPQRGSRICISGGRYFEDRAWVWDALDRQHAKSPINEIGFGCATGVDDHGWAWARYRSIAWQRYVADWDRWGTPAGAIRNGVMLADFRPDQLLVFPGGVGTTDCTRKARKWGIERVFCYPENDPFTEATKWG